MCCCSWTINTIRNSSHFIEPIRAVVDAWVYDSITDRISIAEKQAIIELLQAKVFVDGKWFRLNDAIEDIVDSYIAFLNEKTEEVLRIDVKKGIQLNCE